MSTVLFESPLPAFAGSEYANTMEFAALPRHDVRPLDMEMNLRVREIIDHRALTALFQPIVDLRRVSITAYEGLIRGPSNSPLHSPLQLFRAAELCALEVEVEHLCRRVTLESYNRLDLPGDIFLNVSPACLLGPEARYGETLSVTRELGIDPRHVVIELTEHQPNHDYELLRDAVRHYRSMGFRIAIDDLGEGFSSLRLWSELRPEFVKIDMHFIQGCDADPVKKHFLRSIQEIARNSGCRVIAEGIETVGELNTVRDIGIALGQGYFFARPSAVPPFSLSGEVTGSFRHRAAPAPVLYCHEPVAASLMLSVEPLSPASLIDDAYALFKNTPELQSLAVVDNGVPRGIIGRYSLIDRLARPYQRELFGRKPCHVLMNPSPLMVEAGTSVQELGRMIAGAGACTLAEGFIVVENGLYRGLGTSQDLMREITRLQVLAAQHANPLTGLPGNGPINSTIGGWLENGETFRAAYCDLDHFKPFNDAFGFACGDDVIRQLAQAISEHADVALDFVGHIGGDDFMVLFRSDDWEARCQRMLDQFAAAVRTLYAPADFERGGYVAEDRRGERAFVPLVSLSIGIVHVEPQHFTTHHEVSSAAAIAKKEAKKMVGNSLFVERREG